MRLLTISNHTFRAATLQEVVSLERRKCPNIANVYFFTRVMDLTAEILKRRYCKGNYTECAGYKVKQRCKSVPEELWPDGKIVKLYQQ